MRFTAIAVVLMLAAMLPVPAWAMTALVISTYHKDLPAQIMFESGMKERLRFHTGEHTVFFEYLDSPRLSLADTAAAMAEALPRRFRGVAVDAVVAVAPEATDFLMAHPELFPTAARLYVEVTVTQAEALRRSDGLFMTTRTDTPESIREALRISGARQIYPIGATTDPTGLGRLVRFRDATRDLPGVEVREDLIDLPLSTLLDRVAALPRGSIVYYLLLFNDGTGRHMRPYDAAAALSQRTAVPMFTAWGSLLGSGVTGGLMFSNAALGDATGQALIQLLQERRPAEKVAAWMAEASQMRLEYDWQQLRRWNIGESRLLPGTALVNRVPGIFEQYRWQITGAAVAVILLLVLSGVLARLLVLRRQAIADLAAERASLAQRVAERTAELDAKSVQLARSNAELEAFAYAVSHDLRTPLRNISTFTTLLQRRYVGAMDDEAREFLGFVVSGALRMDAMIRGLLEFSRIGRAGHEPGPVDLADILKETVDTLQPQFDEVGAQVSMAVDAMPPVAGVRSELLRLFQNLVENAVKYRDPQRRLDIAITAGRADDTAVISVADNGIGMDPGQVEQAFRLFRRLHGDHPAEGYGVGLALCRRIVDTHGGTITVDSQVGRGSTFRIALPLRQGD